MQISNNMAKICTHGKSWYCYQCSLTVLTVYWLNKWDENSQKYKPTYYYSDLAEDHKSQEAGIHKLRKRVIEANAGKFQSWVFYDTKTKAVLDSLGIV